MQGCGGEQSRGDQAYRGTKLLHRFTLLQIEQNICRGLFESMQDENKIFDDYTGNAAFGGNRCGFIRWRTQCDTR